MLVRDFECLPEIMRTKEVRAYYDMLQVKRGALVGKRVFDIAAALVLSVLLLPVMSAVALLIKADSKGPVFYRQERLTARARPFNIIKFRTMSPGSDTAGALLTVAGDKRVTRVGKKLRASRLDELPQLFNVILGDMSFVGTRPEVEKYVMAYTPEMLATLLLPAGVTSAASILYKGEAALLSASKDPDAVYAREILPLKMAHNLEYLRDYSFWGDIKILFRTLFPAS